MHKIAILLYVHLNCHTHIHTRSNEKKLQGKDRDFVVNCPVLQATCSRKKCSTMQRKKIKELPALLSQVRLKGGHEDVHTRGLALEKCMPHIFLSGIGWTMGCVGKQTRSSKCMNQSGTPTLTISVLPTVRMTGFDMCLMANCSTVCASASSLSALTMYAPACGR